MKAILSSARLGTVSRDGLIRKQRSSSRGRRLGWLFLALALAALTARAQSTNDVEELKKQLRQLQENFERIQREQRQQIEALTHKVEDLTKQQSAEADKKKLEEELAKEVQTNAPPAAASAGVTAASTKWTP